MKTVKFILIAFLLVVASWSYAIAGNVPQDLPYKVIASYSAGEPCETFAYKGTIEAFGRCQPNELESLQVVDNTCMQAAFNAETLEEAEKAKATCEQQMVQNRSACANLEKGMAQFRTEGLLQPKNLDQGMKKWMVLRLDSKQLAGGVCAARYINEEAYDFETFLTDTCLQAQQEGSAPPACELLLDDNLSSAI